MKTTTTYGNCLLIYGGKICDCANLFMRSMAEKLKQSELFDHIFLGFYSFEALIKPKFVQEWTEELSKEAKESHGGYFGTCSGIELTEPELQKQAIKTCKELGITWILVGGDDESSRKVAEIAKAFKKEGIKLVFVMPCTMYGIEGGWSFGIRPTVRMSCKLIKQLVATSINTRDNGKPPILIVEVPGGHRNDILANILCEIHEDRVNLGGAQFGVVKQNVFAIPSGCEWNCVMEVNKSCKPVLIIISDGADINMNELKKYFNRKTITFSLVELLSINGMTNNYDIDVLNTWINSAYDVLCSGITKGKSFSLVYNKKVRLADIEYYARLNPREDQKPNLTKKLRLILKHYAHIYD